ncbi:MAG: pantoate--beta-alanine ligase [Flavobacteriaceae bacterium]|jgi:pantoate--beta-alanine ligase|nr:pantoate--beta-alanine ligase [Flavobacteriaceae bacterium]
MEIFKSKKTLENFIERNKEMEKKIGFAPTMGALHAGHISLYQKARTENDVVVSSIFVNPTQFNNSTDFEKYPQNMESDIGILRKTNLVDVIYIPTVADIYFEKIERKKYDFGGLENEMEGKFRPGHFDGVGTVVEELFRQVKPDNAYFGEKDFQQLLIIKKLVEKLGFPIKIHGVEIFREPNGLAMSSRNERLTKRERENAKIIYETLLNVNVWFGNTDIAEIKKRVSKIFNNQKDMKLEYFIITNETDLKETDVLQPDKNYRAFIAVFVKDVRLIDNLRLVRNIEDQRY